MAILVCGGAGYIGSHTVAHLLEMGEEVIVLDNLENGHAASLKFGGKLLVGDLRDAPFVRDVFRAHPVDTVIDFAAYIEAGESMRAPFKFYRNNFVGALTLLECMAQADVRRIVFSSTAAVYGQPEQSPIAEEQAKHPVNCYGDTKLAVERLLHWADAAHGIKSICLRYFNASGAHPDGCIGEDHTPETHLIPIAIAAALGKRELTLFGMDYPTPDGTCVRDYIHVSDLASAHYLALKALRAGAGSGAYNLGNGAGYSNREIIEAVARAAGRRFPVQEGPRRPGDPAVLIASSQKAADVLGWKPAFLGLDAIVGSAFQWHQAHPEGYGKP